MIAFVLIAFLPACIIIQGLTEDLNRPLSNLIQYFPIVVLAFAAIPRFRIGNGVVPKVFCAFAASTLLSMLFSDKPMRPEGLRDSLIVGTTLFALSFPFRWDYRRFRAFAFSANLAFIIGQLVAKGPPMRFNLIEGISNWEHHTFGFVLSLTCLVAFLKRDWWLYSLSLITTLLSMKRIAFLGDAIAVIGFYSPFASTRQRRGLVIAGAFLFLLLVSLNIDWIAHFLANTELVTGSRDFFSGRDMFISQIKTEIFQELGPSELVFGNGPGYASVLAFELFKLKHIHNDFVRIFLDYGPLGITVWMWISYRIACLGRVEFALMIFQLVVFLTDNTFVFYGHLVTFYLLIKAEEGQRAAAAAEALAPAPAQVDSPRSLAG